MTYQARFAHRWGRLHNPHVRALAWLLDSPDLLDTTDPAWGGKLATPTVVTAPLVDWLFALDATPAPLLAALGERTWTRLGLYAEQLMAFFYQSQGRLLVHGLQVRASRNDTVGEFDFLLSTATDGIEHIELATKFYLLQEVSAKRRGVDSLLGPNLADSLGAKMRKIIDKQLVLGTHPAAQALLPGPLARARALVKGWLFYASDVVPMAGIAADHCSGFWCTVDALTALPAARWVVLPRLQWLAPYRLEDGAGTLDADGLASLVSATFETIRAPLMVASLTPTAGDLVEATRGFIVPADWPARAQALG